MQLDRNKNPDGRGKYALINLRTNQVQWGGDDQFFVIKYKDEFAGPALRAYAAAARKKAHGLMANAFSEKATREATELHEFADEMDREAEIAENWPVKKLPD